MDSYFHFNPTTETLLVLVAAIICVGLSVLLIALRGKAYEKAGHFILRDFLQVFALGCLFPIWFVISYWHQSMTVIGLTLTHWPYAVIADLILATALALMFLNEHKGKKLHFRWGDVTYLMVTGIFEVVFFYGFLRYYFELAFGIVPAIILASIFYSLHRIGFDVQMRGSTTAKELSKLTLVGIMYATVFRISNSALAIYPLFWGVGASFDVLIEKEGRNFPWKNALVILGLMVLSFALMIGKFI